MDKKMKTGDNGLANRFFMNNYCGFNPETGEWYDYEFKSNDEIIKALRDQASGRLLNDIYSDSNLRSTCLCSYRLIGKNRQGQAKAHKYPSSYKDFFDFF